jgi:hypothetical protein
MATQPLTKFNSGELSPLLLGQTENPAYASGLRRGRNAIVIPHGPVYRRTGTRRAGAARTTAKFTASFVFGPGDAYTLEFSDLKLRFWRTNRTQVLDGFGAITELTTPWTAAQARELRWHQSADVMWFTHPSVAMQELRRTVLGPPETFTLAAAAFVDGPYYSENTSATTLAAAAASTGPVTVNASANLFASTDVGRLVRLKASAAWAWGKITAYAGPTQVTVNFTTAPDGTGATGAWRLGLYSDTTGHPSCICIHQERMTLGSNVSNSFPRVDLSKSGGFLNFTPGTDDDSAIQIVAAADAVPVIRDVRSERVLIVVTGSGVQKVTTSTTSTALTPLNVDISKVPTSTGGGNVRAMAAQGSVLYLDPQRRTLGEIRSSSQVYADALTYREISIRNEHLLRDSPAVSMAWADKPWGQVCIAREDGALIMGAYAPEQDVIAFMPQHLAGGGKVLSVNTVPTSEGDEVWMLVDRAGVLTMEALSNQLRNTEHDREAVNLDQAVTVRDARVATLTKISEDAGAGTQLWRASASVFVAGDASKAIRVLERGDNDALNMPTWHARTLRIQSVDSGTDITVKVEGNTAPTSPVASGDWLVSLTQVTGLLHLDGQSVRALLDGADCGPFTVSGDTHAISAMVAEIDVWVATVGLAYRSEVQPMPPNPPTKKGGAVGRPVRDVRDRIRVVRSGGLRQRRWNGQDSDVRPLRKGIQPMDATPLLYTGDMHLEGAAKGDTPIGPFIVADGAQPFCIAFLGPEYGVGETG